MSKGICYIIGACSECCTEFRIQKKANDLIIAADGGFDLLKRQDIVPDILIGDFDSIQTVPVHDKIIRYPKKKDETDTFLAYKTALNNGYKNFVILGGVGGRFDHTIANVQTLLNVAKNGGRAFLIGENTITTTIFNSKIEFSDKQHGCIGVFAQGNIAKNVCISGLLYDADCISIFPDMPIGVSNEFVGKSASIEVSDGALMIVWNVKFNDFIMEINKFTLK